MSTTPPTAPPAWRRRLRLALPSLLLGGTLLTAAHTYVRGTWASATAHDPASAAEGPICQLYRSPDGRKQVRCAAVLPYPRERIWAVVTAYAHYPDFIPYLTDVEASRQADGNWQVSGQAAAAFSGSWPFVIHVREEKSPQRWRAAWDDAGDGEVLVNRGGWELTPHGEGETLVVLTLEAEVKGYPTFFLRNFFLHRVKEVMRNLDRHLQQ